MKNHTCCFTGHRIIPKNEYPQIKKSLVSEITNLINQGIRYFGVGGALGFDIMAALTVLELREKHSHIRLILVLPCKGQTKGWNKKDIKIYNQILHQANKVVYISNNYYKGCMHKRN